MPGSFESRPVQIHPSPLPDGRICYPVPTSPVGNRFARAICIAPADDPMKIDSVSLIIERSMVVRFAEFLARHGVIDREPTEDETSALMQTVGDLLGRVQVDAMSTVSEALSDTLGDPNADPDTLSTQVAASMAEQMATERARAENRTPEQAKQDAEELRERIQEWADRKLREIDGEERGA